MTRSASRTKVFRKLSMVRRFTLAGLLLWMTLVALAAGLRGDTFLTVGGTAGDYPFYTPTHVDLWDVATLRPRRRLFEEAVPNVWPAACGLAVWFVVFVVRCTRPYRRAARARRATVEAGVNINQGLTNPSSP